jgi:tripartite tricarboxylate transporter TctB family protein
MPTAKFVTRARAEGLVILLVALGYVWEARRIPALYVSPGVPGPAAFPSVLGLVLGLAGLWRLLRGEPAAAVGAEEEEARPATAAGAAPSRQDTGGRFYLLWAVLLGFLASMPDLGFPVAAFLGLASLFRLLGERRWKVILPLSLVITAVLHPAFSHGLGVRLPLGILQQLLEK